MDERREDGLRRRLTILSERHTMTTTLVSKCNSLTCQWHKSDDISVDGIIGGLPLNFRSFKVQGILLAYLNFKVVNMTVAKILEKSKFSSIF